MRPIGKLLLILTMILAAVTVNAQKTGEIVPGVEVTGALSAEQPTASYTFAGSRGDLVTILYTSEDFDTYLVLLDSDGAELAADDDSAGDLNAQITGFELPQDGTYTIIADSIRHHRSPAVFASGDFSLKLTLVSPSPQGMTFMGALTSDSPAVRHSIRGRGGDIVTITMISADFDSYLELLDPQGAVVASDDDSKGSLNAQIQAFELPADGMYTVVADSTRHHTNPAHISTGAYTLTIEGIDPSETADVLDGAPLHIGDTVTGSLTQTEPSAQYSLTGKAGDRVLIKVSSRDFDSYVILRDASGAELASDDDSGGSLDARIGPYELPGDGLYTIIVSSFGASADGVIGTGSYALSVISPDNRPIGYGDLVKERINTGDEFITYSFSGERGDTVVITLESDDYYVDIVLAAEDDIENVLATSQYFYGASPTNMRIGPFELPESGDYAVLVHHYDDIGGTVFSLRLEQVQLTRLAYDEPITIALNQGDEKQYFSFEGYAGDTVEISVDSGGTIDTSMIVTGPHSDELASDDDSGSGFDPEISRLILREDGLHYILLEAYGDEAGQVSLLVRPVQLPSLDSGPVQIRLTDNRYEDVVTLTGTAGEKIRLIVRVVGRTETAEPYVTVTQRGKYLAYASGSNVSSLSLEFTVPEDGPVNVTIEEYSYSGVTLEITMVKVANV